MHLDTMSTTSAAFFAVLVLAVIGLFPVMEALKRWRMARHLKAERREQLKHARHRWRRMFVWTVFSTRRVPRLTDERDAEIRRQQ